MSRGGYRVTLRGWLVREYECAECLTGGCGCWCAIHACEYATSLGSGAEVRRGETLLKRLDKAQSIGWAA